MFNVYTNCLPSLQWLNSDAACYHTNSFKWYNGLMLLMVCYSFAGDMFNHCW